MTRLRFVATLFLLLVPLRVRGEDRDPLIAMGESGFLDGNLLSYQISDAPERSEGSPKVLNEQEDGRFVVARSTTDTWSVHERAGRFHLSSPVTIPQSGLVVPQTFWSVEAGGAYRHKLESGRSLGLNLSLGSDSDRLFNSIHETVVRGTANYRLPIGENRSWLFFLTYSNNRHFLNNVPLPGFAYSTYSPSLKLRAVLGFPFIALLYTPTPLWEARASLFGPRHLTAEIGYRAAAFAQLYGRFEWGQQEWLRADRDDNANRLFYARKRLAGGVRTPLGRGLSLDTSVGREYARHLFENSSSSYRSVPAVSLPSSWDVEAKLSWKFAATPL